MEISRESADVAWSGSDGDESVRRVMGGVLEPLVGATDEGSADAFIRLERLHERGLLTDDEYETALALLFES